jgi:hypothetical protein
VTVRENAREEFEVAACAALTALIGQGILDSSDE